MKYIKLLMILPLLAVLAFALGCTRPDDEGVDVVGVNDTGLPVETAAPTAVPTEEPDPTPEPSPTAVTDPDPDHPYYLYVEKGSHTLTIYGKDENFDYTVVVSVYKVAHGGNRTPTGIFTLSGERERWHDFPLGGSAQYATPYWGNLFLHSPMYTERDPSTMWKGYYNGTKGIGSDSTGGCLRMVTEAAKFIYKYCPEGTKLEIVNGSPRGTTSPDVPEITRKGYDPTDVDALNGD